MRRYEVATAAVFILIAAVAMLDTRGGALPDPRGGAPGGLKGGWYPFWSAGLIVLACAIVAYQALTRPQPAEGIFRGRASLIALGQLIIPLIVVTYLLSDGLLGFYLASGLYMAYFARFTTHYRWIWSLTAGVLTPSAIYFVFELGFRATFPKSFLYPGLPF